MPTIPVDDYTGVALEFAKALTRGDHAAAYEVTARDYQRRVSLEAMQAAFDAMVPADFGPCTSVDVGLTQETWPDKQPSDIGWVYVSIGGDVYSEAVTVVVTMEDGMAKVRDVQFGRP